MSAVKRMLKVTTGRHWWHLDADSRYWMDSTDHFQHLLRYHDKPLRKRKYYRRKDYFIKYESHRKKGVEYLPF